jgi:hypothetical protein
VFRDLPSWSWTSSVMDWRWSSSSTITREQIQPCIPSQHRHEAAHFGVTRGKDRTSTLCARFTEPPHHILILFYASYVSGIALLPNEEALHHTFRVNLAYLIGSLLQMICSFILILTSLICRLFLPLLHSCMGDHNRSSRHVRDVNLGIGKAKTIWRFSG